MKNRNNKYLIVFLSIVLVAAIIEGNIYWNTNHAQITTSKTQTKTQVQVHTHKWQDKKWDAIGDSITALDVYQDRVKNLTQLGSVNSYGISGTCITAINNKDIKAMCNRVDNIDHSAAIISIFGGTNDWGKNRVLGNKDDTSTRTFYGALKIMLKKLKKQNPQSKIIMFTPLQRNSHVQGQLAGMTANLNGNSLLDYVLAIKYVGKLDDVPVLDLYNTSGITEQNIDQYTKDGLHPNKAGFKMISKVIADFIDEQ